jgi:hypothetical protein
VIVTGEDTTYQVKALAVLEIPSMGQRAFECSPKDHNNSPGIYDGLDTSGEPFIFGGWRKTPNKHDQR